MWSGGATRLGSDALMARGEARLGDSLDAARVRESPFVAVQRAAAQGRARMAAAARDAVGDAYAALLQEGAARRAAR